MARRNEAVTLKAVLRVDANAVTLQAGRPVSLRIPRGIQVLHRAGHSLTGIARLVGVSQRSVQRIAMEPAVTTGAVRPASSRSCPGS